MTHFAGKAVKAIVLGSLMTLLLTASALAAENGIAVGVGATTGSSLRMRAEASTSSSIVTMLDKGVAVAILDDSNEDWFHISYNGSTGYVSADYMIVDQDNLFTTYGRANGDGVNVRAEATTESDVAGTIDKGTIVTVNGFADGWYKVTCKYGTEGYIRSDLLDLTSSATATGNGSGMVSTAMQYLGVRYVYGGASPSGFDCSGFTMYVAGQYGVSLPHTATGQWQSGKGTKIWAISALEPGDLVYFCDPSRSLGKACSHTGIYIGNGQFVHASSSRSNGVIISDLTSGYYNNYYVGGLRIV